LLDSPVLALAAASKLVWEANFRLSKVFTSLPGEPLLHAISFKPYAMILIFLNQLIMNVLT
jgi:hypothetical protein